MAEALLRGAPGIRQAVDVRLSLGRPAGTRQQKTPLIAGSINLVDVVLCYAAFFPATNNPRSCFLNRDSFPFAVISRTMAA